jgi:iron complex outermembrane receptor protein
MSETNFPHAGTPLPACTEEITMDLIRCGRGGGLLALLSVALAQPVLAQLQVASLLALSLEELSNIEITSASRRAEPLSGAPTSVFVITADDIRRSGATSLPEVLRLAPNLQVARTSAQGWAISSRGFSGTSANKLLVLIDGRSVYTPLFGGVFWDVQDPVLEDVERIEVISGPGGTLWGVNAVNGVINVITKAAAHTQGTLLSGGFGNREDQVTLRQGLALGEGAHLRLYARHSGQKHTATAAGTPVDDAGHQARLGLRADWGSARDTFTLQGDAYRGRHGQPAPGSIAITGLSVPLGAIDVSGANLLGRWEGRRENGDWSVQAYYDRTERDIPPFFREQLELLDLQLQQALRPQAAHTLVWGAQYRLGRDQVENSPYFAFLPGRLNQHWTSLFAQDEIRLREPLRLTLGARLERNDYTGWEFLPNARLAWRLGPEHLLWTAVSRTVRAPTRLDHDPFVPGKPPFLLAGGSDVRSETAHVVELGYRGQPTAQATYSLTAFQARYDDLRTQQLVLSPTPHVIFSNGMEGRVSGVEMWGVLQPAAHWRLQGGFTRLWQDLRLKPGSTDALAADAVEGANPRRHAVLRSSLDLPRGVELDLAARYVSRLPGLAVPGYVAVDLRLGWQPHPDLELSLGVQNLFDRDHGEFTITAPVLRSEFGRTAFLRLILRR